MRGGSADEPRAPRRPCRSCRVNTRTLSRVRALATLLAPLRLLPPQAPSVPRRRTWSREAAHLELVIPGLEGAHARGSRIWFPVRPRPVHDHVRRSAARTRGTAHHFEAGGQTLTSHSHGPGSVSSKSLMSKIIWRFGVRRPRSSKVGIAAELHGHAGVWGGGEVSRHQHCRPTEEGERRTEHAPVADRDQVGHPTAAWSSNRAMGSGRPAQPFKMGAPVPRPRQGAEARRLPPASRSSSVRPARFHAGDGS